MRAVEALAQDWLQRGVDQGGLTAAAYSSDTDERAQGERDVNVLEVIATASCQAQALAIALATPRRDLDGKSAIQIVGGEGVLFQQFSWRAGKHDVATLATR